MSGECEKCGMHALECECNVDALLSHLIISCKSQIDTSVQEKGPTTISLQDTVNLIENKYGKDWRNYPECKSVVIWASRIFILDHVKKVVPDLFDLCKEYHETNTVNGKKFPENFYLLALNMIA